MELAIQATKTEKTPSKTFKSIRQNSTRIKEKEGNREGQTTPLAVTTVYSTKAGFPGGPPNSGSVSTKFVHSMPFFQNANHKGNQVSSTTRILDNLHRFPRRLLARARSPEQKTLSRVYIQKPRLPVQGYALRFECRAADIHKSNVAFSESTSERRYMVPSIPRRPTADSSNTRRVHQNWSNCSNHHQGHGLTHKREEVETHTSSGLRMARNTVESPIIHGASGRKEIFMPTGGFGVNHNIKTLHKKNSDENSGSLQLDRSKRPQYSPPHDNNKNYSKVPFQSTSRLTHSNTTELEDTPVRLGKRKSISTTSGITNTGSNDPNGCFSSRLGIHNKSDTLQREIHPLNEVLHQHQGTNCHLVSTFENLRKEHHNTGSVRQLFRHSSFTERRINVLSSLLTSRANMEESNTLQLDTQSITYKRNFQCNSRSTIQEQPNLNRMVSIRQGLSEGSRNEPTSRSGSFRNKTEQETSNICVTMSRPRSNSSELTNNSLGQMEPPLPVPTDSFDFEGFVSSEPVLIHERSAHHTRHADETLVYGSTTAESPIDSSRSETSTNSSEQTDDPTTHYQASRVEVIRTAYRTKFNSDQQTLSLLATPIRQSSLNDYEIKWNKFCSYLRERGITPLQLSLASVLEFLSYLFYEKNLRPNTVSHYRSALTVPLRLKFNIDLHDPAVSHLLRSMSIKRPNNPSSAPKWCLNKVLQLLDSWTTNLPLDKLLQKTIFLLLLATAWRVSELHACVRLMEFCSISVSHTLTLRPHPSFLAKNECPQKRWPHKTILPLHNPNGSRSNLCPVASLAEYLRRTSRIKTGSLLIHPSTQKPLSKYQLSAYACKIIHNADPQKKAKPHDIRKYAASCSLAATMNITGMINALQWKSPYTFWKFYMSPTVPLTVPATLPRVDDLNPGENTSPHTTSDYTEADLAEAQH